jgi:hypothetical protein
MFVIASLCMLKIYQTRHPDIMPGAHKTYLVLAVVSICIMIGVVGLFPIIIVFISYLRIASNLGGACNSLTSQNINTDM